MKVSIVSDSRWAARPHLGHGASMNPGAVFSGDLSDPVRFDVGRQQYRKVFVRGPGTTPQCGQWIIGIGVPQ